MHFTAATHNTRWQVVYSHVCLLQDIPRLRLPPYPDLCAGGWNIIPLSQPCPVAQGQVDTKDTRDKLEAGQIWQDVQPKVK